MGVDKSKDAINLARRNLDGNIFGTRMVKRARHQVKFVVKDVLTRDFGSQKRSGTADIQILTWDIVISNPPYISPRQYDTTTSKSVRDYEPKEALVPPDSFMEKDLADEEQGDVFYSHIIRLSNEVKAKMLLMEVGDRGQAHRIAKLVLQSGVWQGCEIWRDEPAVTDANNQDDPATTEIDGQVVEVKGKGNHRAVFAWRAPDASPVQNLMMNEERCPSLD